MDITKVRRVHFVGIKGVAMTALALCMQDNGAVVSGSDVGEEFVTDEVLKRRDIQIQVGFSPGHIQKDVELVVYTGAHQGGANIEVAAARSSGIACYSHAQALGMFTAGKRLISVCGTGGKSTTSAMIAWILEYAGMRPSFAVGVGNISNFGVPGRYVQDSPWFVAEADEYAIDPQSDKRPRFTYQEPRAIVCTNLNYDHPDIYSSFAALKQTFTTFFKRGNTLYTNADNVDLFEIFTKMREGETVDFESMSVGFTDKADYMISEFISEMNNSRAVLRYKGASERQPFTDKDSSWDIHLSLPGEYNMRNASLAFLVCVGEAGVKPSVALAALAEFRGTMRRFEYKGVVQGALWYDDYAHTPDEIRATLKAARTWYPEKKIIAIFQPHTYSRTQSLFDEFSRCFTEADEVLLMDIFASARETFNPNITSDKLANAIQENSKEKFVKNMKTKEMVAQRLRENLHSDQVVMTIGAGDVYTLYSMMEKQ